MDMKIMVKLSVARSSGKLDLSNCGLTEVPEELCSIIDLEVYIHFTQDLTFHMTMSSVLSDFRLSDCMHQHSSFPHCCKSTNVTVQ